MVRKSSRSTVAPVLTLWAAIIAKRLGCDEDVAVNSTLDSPEKFVPQ